MSPLLSKLLLVMVFITTIKTLACQPVVPRGCGCPVKILPWHTVHNEHVLTWPYRKQTMEEVGQNPLDDEDEITEIPTLEAIKQNLKYLNSNLEKDLQRLDEANQILFRQIQKKEESIQSLERDIALSVGRVPERDDFNEIIVQKETALKDLELETAKLEKKNKTLSKNVMELQKKVSKGHKNAVSDPETMKKKVAEFKVKLQKLTESCAQQEKEIAKMESDYQSVFQLCEDQTHYIKWDIPISDFEIKTKILVYDALPHGKKYQEILREMEKEKEVMLLEKEISKAQSDSSQVVKPGSTLVETIQSNMEKNIIKKQKRKFWFRHFRYLFFVIMIIIRLLGYVFFHLQYINPDFLVDTLPMLVSRSNLKRLRDILFPFLTLEVEDVLPH